MKTKCLFFLLTFVAFLGSAQELSLEEYEPEVEFDNIHVQKISEDSLQSTFIIWVKKGVKEHYHAQHTENLIVLEGKAEMTLGDSTFIIEEEDYLNIPMGMKHSVTRVISKKPLKVISIQSPRFDGSDRIFIKEE